MISPGNVTGLQVQRGTAVGRVPGPDPFFVGRVVGRFHVLVGRGLTGVEGDGLVQGRRCDPGAVRVGVGDGRRPQNQRAGVHGVVAALEGRSGDLNGPVALVPGVDDLDDPVVRRAGFSGADGPGHALVGTGDGGAGNVYVRHGLQVDPAGVPTRVIGVGRAGR